MSRAADDHKLLGEDYIKILDLLHDGVYISNREGVTLSVNLPYEKLTGVPASEVIGRNVYDLVDEGFYDVAVNPEVVATGESVTSVQEVNGRKVVLHGHPILDKDGQVELVVTFVRDITVFSRLKDEINAQRDLVDYYQRQVATLDPEAVFLDDGMVAISQPLPGSFGNGEQHRAYQCDGADRGRNRGGQGCHRQTDLPPKRQER